jgi:hypothetical protein
MPPLQASPIRLPDPNRSLNNFNVQTNAILKNALDLEGVLGIQGLKGQNALDKQMLANIASRSNAINTALIGQGIGRGIPGVSDPHADLLERNREAKESRSRAEIAERMIGAGLHHTPLGGVTNLNRVGGNTPLVQGINPALAGSVRGTSDVTRNDPSGQPDRFKSNELPPMMTNPIGARNESIRAGQRAVPPTASTDPKKQKEMAKVQKLIDSNSTKFPKFKGAKVVDVTPTSVKIILSDGTPHEMARTK